MIQNDREILGVKCAHIMIKFDHDCFDSQENEEAISINKNITDKIFHLDIKKNMKPMLKDVLESINQSIRETEQEISMTRIELHRVRLRNKI